MVVGVVSDEYVRVLLWAWSSLVLLWVCMVSSQMNDNENEIDLILKEVAVLK